MSEAGSLQAMYDARKDRGFMAITALDGNETDKLLEWAETYEITHPVVGDGDGAFFWDFSKYSSWPMRVLVDHGVVLTSIDDGAWEAEVDALLEKYE